MTLDQYIANGLPTYQDAAQYGLVMDAALKDALLATQSSLPPSQNRVAPAALTDGRWMIRAALLTEIDGGLYAQGFAALDPQLFAQVEVISMQDIDPLLPKDTEP
jgi:hypothetical protein